MNKITIKEEGNIIDLTDDPPYEVTTEAPDIEFVGATRSRSWPIASRRRKSNNSDVVMVEDEVPAVIDDVRCTIPQVACHFFYPSEEDRGGTGGYDPLAPIPEWVDCSTLLSEQVSVDDDDELRILESLPEKNATSSAYVDPLCITVPIKTEPNIEEIDVKPSLAQLSKVVVPAENTIECSPLKNESQNGDDSINNKRKNSHDIDLNISIPPKKLKTRGKIGPKCAQFRQQEKEMSTSNPNIKWTNPENTDINTSLPPKQTNTTRKIGPKFAQFGQKEKEMSTSNPNIKWTNPENTDINTSLPPKKTNTTRKIGPKVAQFRQKEKKMSTRNPNIKSTNPENTINTSLPPKQTNTTRKIGPKFAQFRQKEKKMSTRNPNIKSTNPENTDINTRLPPKETNTTRKIGPKCAQFRQKEKEMSTSNPNIKWINPRNSDINTRLPPQQTNATRKFGPKCAQFRQKEKEMSTSNPNIKWINPRNSDINTTLPPQQTNTTRKIGPKCAKFRVKERKTTDFNSKDFVSHNKTLPQDVEVEQHIVIKPAVVSIGPKLPLPQCFQRIQSQSQGAVQISKYEFADKSDNEPNNHFDKDHIVLKIYTCFKCNHKCTDPLFHEEHLNVCSAKRRTKSLNLSFQDFNKQNGFYKCEICSFRFKNQENLSKHLNQHGVKGFICHICQFSFLTLHQLHQHTIGDHKDLEKVFSCNTCEYSSQSVHHLKDHMIKHNTDKHLFCSSCKHNYENTEEIEKHREEFHRRTKTKSDKNNKIKQIESAKTESINFSNYKQTTIMTAENKGQLEANESKINEEAPSENSLTTMSSDVKCPASVLTNFEAQKIRRRNGKYCCNGCKYNFVHLKNLTKHKKNHLRNKPFSCCNGSFMSLSYVDFFKHAKVNHDKFFKFTCSMCPHSFVKHTSLGEHMVRHVNDGLFCHQCRKNLENADAYRSHVSKMHANMSAAKYTCMECSFSTPLQSILNRHLKRHSINNMQSETLTHVKYNESGAKPTIKESQAKKSKENVATFDISHDQNSDLSTSNYNCTVCSLKLSSAAALQEHIKYAHEPDQPIMKTEYNSNFENEGFRCNKCTFKCSQPNRFIEHMKKGHTKRKLICNICRSEFAFLKLYLDHMKNHAACAVVFSCNECRFTSRKVQVFAKHMRTHALKCCPLCDYKTLRCDSFKSHLETIHTVGNECPSSWSTEPQSFGNTSAVKTKGNLSEKLDSTLNNDIAKPHACCFCTFKTTHIHDLRSHMAVHFNSNCDPKNDKLSKKVSKPSLTVERWKSKTLPTKTARRGIHKVSKPSPTVMNGLTLFYCCTKCDYKKKTRRSVADHLVRKHNTRGAVKNCTIKKVYVKEPPTKDMDVNMVCENGNMKSNTQSLEMDNKLSCVAKNEKNERGLNVSKNIIDTDQQSTEKRRKGANRGKTKSSFLWKCSSCDLQKLSLLAQLQHRKYGHMGFWRRSFSCKTCGFRCADKGNLAKHLKWKHKEMTKEHQQLNQEEMLERIEDNSRRADDLGTGSNADVTEKQNLIVNKTRRQRKLAIVKCPKCNIEGFSKPAQYQHSKLGHKEFWDRAFSCEICEMRFLNKGAYGMHKLSHEKPFVCSKCNIFVPFKLKALHKRTCRGLGKGAIKSEETSPHHSHETQDIGNGIRDPSSDEDETFVCGECDFVTTNVIKFSTHMFVHSGIPDD